MPREADTRAGPRGEARRAANLTQAEAALLVTPAAGAWPERTWQNYEAAEGTKAHRAILLAAWELFLLLTEQHPAMQVALRKTV